MLFRSFLQVISNVLGDVEQDSLYLLEVAMVPVTIIPDDDEQVQMNATSAAGRRLLQGSDQQAKKTVAVSLVPGGEYFLFTRGYFWADVQISRDYVETLQEAVETGEVQDALSSLMGVSISVARFDPAKYMSKSELVQQIYSAGKVPQGIVVSDQNQGTGEGAAGQQGSTCSSGIAGEEAESFLEPGHVDIAMLCILLAVVFTCCLVLLFPLERCADIAFFWYHHYQYQAAWAVRNG